MILKVAEIVYKFSHKLNHIEMNELIKLITELIEDVRRKYQK